MAYPAVMNTAPEYGGVMRLVANTRVSDLEEGKPTLPSEYYCPRGRVLDGRVGGGWGILSWRHEHGPSAVDIRPFGCASGRLIALL